MRWDCRPSDRAGPQALNEMKESPLGGAIVRLRGEDHGAFIGASGPWRIILTIKPEHRVMLIHDIARRTSTTY